MTAVRRWCWHSRPSNHFASTVRCALLTSLRLRRSRVPDRGSSPPAAEAPAEAARHPLSEPVFRQLWSANLIGNVGVWMQNVGGGWLMTSLTNDALPVALMQTATTL